MDDFRILEAWLLGVREARRRAPELPVVYPINGLVLKTFFRDMAPMLDEPGFMDDASRYAAQLILGEFRAGVTSARAA